MSTVSDLEAGDSVLGMNARPLVVEAVAPALVDFGTGRGYEAAVDITWRGHTSPVAYAAGVRVTIVR